MIELPDPALPLQFRFDGPIYLAFQTQAARDPNALALASRFEECTYRELDDISDRIAGHLNQQGIGPGQSVVLLADSNPALIFAMLGVLKSGAIFVVAYTAYPAARIP